MATLPMDRELMQMLVLDPKVAKVVFLDKTNVTGAKKNASGTWKKTTFAKTLYNVWGHTFTQHNLA
jgi:hypothetical protein